MQKKEVEGFFNEIAENYKSKYSEADDFLNYFFNERLIEATREYSFENSIILDIGTGTGDLHDYLLSNNKNIDFYGCDIAGNMLDQSNIPANRRFVGLCYEIDFPIRKFDYIFMLGVTTYLDVEEIGKTLDFMHSALEDDGRVIITFTNKRSLDWISRSMFKTLARRIMPKKNVLRQNFKIYAENLTEIEKLVESNFNIEDVRWLNHTVFPFNQILKNSSVKTAKKLHKSLKSKNILNILSSDFLLVLSKK